MNSSIDYRILWYDGFDRLKTIITDFVSLEYVRVENGIGAMNLIIPLANWQYEDFVVDDILEIWRAKAGETLLQNETSYFVQDWSFITDSNGVEFIKVLAYDANWLLDTAIVAFAAASSEASKSGEADDMMKEIVLENLGTAGDRYKCAVASNLTLAPSISKAFSRRNVLTVLQEIAETSKTLGTYLAFDVVRVSTGVFEFRTYVGQRGVDHSQGSGDVRLVSRDYGNLLEPTFITSHVNERNYVYVGGQGEEALREIVERSDATRIAASKWNRREVFRDARNTSTTAGLESEGDSTLGELKPKQILAGKLIDTPYIRYGIEYGFGDILTVEAFGFHVDCHVTSVAMQYDQDKGEQLTINLQGEL